MRVGSHATARVSRRLQSLRGWGPGNHRQMPETSAGARGPVAREHEHQHGSQVIVRYDRFGGGEDRLLLREPAQLGPAARAGPGAAPRSAHSRATRPEGSRTREARVHRGAAPGRTGGIHVARSPEKPGWFTPATRGHATAAGSSGLRSPRTSATEGSGARSPQPLFVIRAGATSSFPSPTARTSP